MSKRKSYVNLKRSIELNNKTNMEDIKLENDEVEAVVIETPAEEEEVNGVSADDVA